MKATGIRDHPTPERITMESSLWARPATHRFDVLISKPLPRCGVRVTNVALISDQITVSCGKREKGRKPWEFGTFGLFPRYPVGHLISSLIPFSFQPLKLEA